MNPIGGQYCHGNWIATREGLQEFLSQGWFGQLKINGRRIEAHLSQEGMIFYTRQGNIHTMPIPEECQVLLRNLIPDKGTTILDGEFLPKQKTIYLFDILMYKEEKLIENVPYLRRYNLLLELMGSSFENLPVVLLSLIDDPEICVTMLKHSKEYVEGLVLKLGSASDKKSIIRALKKDAKV